MDKKNENEKKDTKKYIIIGIAAVAVLAIGIIILHRLMKRIAIPILRLKTKIIVYQMIRKISEATMKPAPERMIPR